MKKLIFTALLLIRINVHSLLALETLPTNLLTSYLSLCTLTIPYATERFKILNNPITCLNLFAFPTKIFTVTVSSAIASAMLVFEYRSQSTIITSMLLGAACTNTLGLIKYNKSLNQLAKNNNQFSSCLIPGIITSCCYYGLINNSCNRAAIVGLVSVLSALLLRTPQKYSPDNAIVYQKCLLAKTRNISINKEVINNILTIKNEMNAHLSKPFLLQSSYCIKAFIDSNPYNPSDKLLVLKDANPNKEKLIKDVKFTSDTQIGFLKRYKYIGEYTNFPPEIVHIVMSFLTYKDLSHRDFMNFLGYSNFSPLPSLYKELDLSIERNISKDFKSKIINKAHRSKVTTIDYISKKRFLSCAMLLDLLSGLIIRRDIGKDKEELYYVGYPPNFVQLPSFLNDYLRTFLGSKIKYHNVDICQGLYKFLYYTGSLDIFGIHEDMINNALAHTSQEGCTYCNLYRDDC